MAAAPHRCASSNAAADRCARECMPELVGIVAGSLGSTSYTLECLVMIGRLGD
jgi:hypothetical protein